ncbi:radical SAM protein [Frankia sp. Mgl5]|uniref:radical SAM/SPASM domain-containing protein n=1 Tax=Frankia sp. Mgl5 TaxID=2933793 RepID=UPI00200EDBA8|nr:radical SAM protein [Frankia sp. Mgl5]
MTVELAVSQTLRAIAAAITTPHDVIPDSLRDAVAVALAHCPAEVLARLNRGEERSRPVAWLLRREALGTNITTPAREGLPGFTTPLGRLSPIEVIAYWHPDPVYRLTANRFARKLDLNVTEVCNYDCSYCYQRSRDDDWETKAVRAEERELAIDEWIAVLDQAHAMGVRRVKITGGEPLTKRGITTLISHAFAKEHFEEVELCTNASLLERHLPDLAGVIEPDRFHIHASIDYLSDDESRTRTATKASPRHMKNMRAMFNGPLVGTRLSINSMWNTHLLDPAQLTRLHDFMMEVGAERWTISFPYFVRDFISACVTDPASIPPYGDIVAAAAHLVALHQERGRPFRLSIPLVYKHELFEAGFEMSGAGRPDDHPCFPCHGSYFVIGPEGDVFDCLLLNRSTTGVRDHASVWDAGVASARGSDFTQLTVREVTEACQGCRYEDICHGQCANDRANTEHQGGGRVVFGRDKTACSLLPRAEQGIWSRLPADQRAALSARLRRGGFIPAQYASAVDVVRMAEPDALDRHVIENDTWLTATGAEAVDTAAFGRVRPCGSGRTASAVFHTNQPAPVFIELGRSRPVDDK